MERKYPLFDVSIGTSMYLSGQLSEHPISDHDIFAVASLLDEERFQYCFIDYDEILAIFEARKHLPQRLWYSEFLPSVTAAQSLDEVIAIYNRFFDAVIYGTLSGEEHRLFIELNREIRCGNSVDNATFTDITDKIFHRLRDIFLVIIQDWKTQNRFGFEARLFIEASIAAVKSSRLTVGNGRDTGKTTGKTVL